jgi:hypothetical protein
MVDAADSMNMTPAHCPRLEAGPSSEGLTGSKRPRDEEADQEEAALTGGVDTPPAEAGVQAAGAAGPAPRSEAGSPGEERAAAAAAGPSTVAVSVLASTWPWNRDVGGPDDVARVVRSQQGGGSLGSLRRGDQESSVSGPVLAGAEGQGPVIRSRPVRHRPQMLGRQVVAYKLRVRRETGELNARSRGA